MQRLLARRHAQRAPSFERMTTEYQIVYGRLLKKRFEVAHG
jgi:hypothetical protein